MALIFFHLFVNYRQAINQDVIIPVQLALHPMQSSFMIALKGNQGLLLDIG